MKIIDMIQLCNNKTYSRVKLGNKVSMTFEIKNGLRQGNTMSPVLVVALDNMVGEMSNEETSINRTE